MVETDFVKQLRKLINCESMENGSNTPDFILAKYLEQCLAAFDLAVNAREEYNGRTPLIFTKTREHISNPDCWCQPTPGERDPVTGSIVWIHHKDN